MTRRNSSRLKYRPLVRSKMARTMPSQRAWKTGSLRSAETGPNPCIPPMSCTPFTASSPQLPPLHIDGNEVRKGQDPTVLPHRHLHAAFRRIRDGAEHSVLEDDVGRTHIAGGCHGRVVVAPQEPAVPIEPESLDAAVDWQVGSIIGLQHALMEFGPFDVRSHQLGVELVAAPEGVPQEIHEIQAVPFRTDAGIL